VLNSDYCLKMLVAFFTVSVLVSFSACTEVETNLHARSVQVNATPIPSLPPLRPESLRYAVFPAPPYMIGAGDTQESVSGIDVDIVQEIARRLQLNVEFVRCTWERCLELAKTGDVDLISSAYKKPDREEYMRYFDRPYLESLPIAFYSLQDKNYNIQVYEDIYQFKAVGVLQGASYFERFDKDPRVQKFEVHSQDQLFPMLLAGRLDVIAGYIPTENYRINVEGYRGKIVRSEFVSQEQVSVFMAVSKKSPFVNRMVEINQINDQLIKEGFVTQIIDAYYARYH
jgi:polar amino acid transport system substrate-binding protein